MRAGCVSPRRRTPHTLRVRVRARSCVWECEFTGGEFRRRYNSVGVGRNVIFGRRNMSPRRADSPSANRSFAEESENGEWKIGSHRPLGERERVK